jgi:CRP-like cAMP-binding protein
MLKKPSNPSSNRILTRLSPEDFGLLQPHLECVELPLRTQLEQSNRRIEHVYFIERGIASVVSDGAGSRDVEVGLIGREGMTGLAIMMETDRSPHRTFMQVAGAGQKIESSLLRNALEQSPSLRRLLLHYCHAFVIQTAQTAMSNARSKIEDRLARWLVMADDRVDGNELPLTHEFLATMLGVRRPGVTVALNLLERSGLIETKRGVVVVIDRQGLEEHSNGAYGASEREFRRLFG